ncbi:rod shape-determining protein RodA [Candidatus Uhrbacteria bacterium]|nr:rod shape-determining protein RodA [Candidatus Uhrbacteria bacterium]
MLSRLYTTMRSYDLMLLLAAVILCSFGFAALYSIGLGKEPVNFGFLQKQLFVFGIFFPIALIIAVINYRVFRAYCVVFYIAVCALLVALLFFGTTIRGTKGWLYFGSFAFQPAELAKIGLILILARYFSSYTRQIGQFRHILLSGLLAALPIGLVFVQPDFGSAVVLVVIWLGMILMSGIPKRFLIFFALAFFVATTCLWLFVFKEYQKQRILTFLSPTADVQGSGYNIRQAMIAIGSGQIFGTGLGLGSQSHLKFLPENQTDFIFSVFAEEMGLLGIFFLLFFWVLLFYRLTTGMRRARDDFAVYALLGIMLMFFVHVIFNIGGNLGLVPLTGLVLPFMSYGGSALAASLLAIGITQSIWMHSV